ncbi:VIER F-box protein 2 [Tanacetum coccineum]
MSLMGEMKFFLGLQIHPSSRGIFINQAKYALEILRKHGMEKCDTVDTPMATKPKLDADLSGQPVDQTDYRSKIRSLMYLTSSRPDIVQADSGFELTAFLDADHAGCIDTRKSTSGGIQFLGDKLVSWMSKKQDCTVMLRWVPTGKIFTSSTTKVDSEPTNGSNEDTTNQYECEQTLDVSVCTLNLSAGISFNPKKEGLRVCSELRIYDHSNEPSSSKLVPKVVPLAAKTATSRQELELLFHHHITMPRRHFKTLSLDELRSPDFNLLSDQEYSEEEVAETMAETMEQYMSNNAFSGTNGKYAKSSMETFVPNDKADYYSRITSITVNGKNVYELKGKFLDEVEQTGRTQIVVFPISLPGGARRWFDRTKESITCWVDLTANFYRKYYPPSRIEENNTPVIKWDPANPRFEGWLSIKFANYKTMDIFTKGALWDYWKIGGDEIEVSDDESSDHEEYWLDSDLLTKDIMGFKTYEDYKDDWIYEWNENVPWVYDKPWLDNGIWKEPEPVEHTCKPFNYKTRCLEWPTCSWREDGYCNGGNLPGTYHIGNSLHYQDLEWYEALEDSELKDEALRNKAIMEGLISDDESSNDCWKRWKSHEIYYHNYDEEEYEN